VELPHFAGWHLLGVIPDSAPDDVGSWLLVHGREAMLLEIPPGLTAEVVRSALDRTETTLRLVTASHDHKDHFDPEAWETLRQAFPAAEFVHPDRVSGDTPLALDGEPVWLVKAPKHSASDVVTVFRGVAMTGDIELGTLASVNREVPRRTKAASMHWLRTFPDRTGYRVHAIMSAHLNDVRTGVDWRHLFEF
jgi:hypothetical protein